jgi:hypothetical protein
MKIQLRTAEIGGTQTFPARLFILFSFSSMASQRFNVAFTVYSRKAANVAAQVAPND